MAAMQSIPVMRAPAMVDVMFLKTSMYNYKQTDRDRLALHSRLAVLTIPKKSFHTRTEKNENALH